jgi:uncharacterized protein DUF4350
MTAVSPDARQLWRVSRGPVAILLVIIAAGIGIALVRGGSEGGALDPRSVAPEGSRALARLLEARGVRITLVQTRSEVDTALASGSATVLVTRPERLRPERLSGLRDRAAELVLVAPQAEAVRALSSAVQVRGTESTVDRAPDCSLPAATAAGVASLGGVRFQATGSDAQTCYSGFLARVGSTTLLGAGTPMTNDSLAAQGNAALSMRLLGQQERLIWYLPSLADPDTRPDQRSPLDLLPDGWVFGAVQLVVAVGFFAIWRARRLGPVVTEPLPVVVRAAETVEGRARLYQRAGAADHAAFALRQAARERLLPRLGLLRDASPDAVVNALAERTGRAGMAVWELLYGPPPRNNAELVRLADALDALENDL